MEVILKWFKEYIFYKASTLSFKTNNNDLYKKAIEILQKNNLAIDEINNAVKLFRKAGAKSIGAYYTPLMRFYYFLDSRGLSELKEINESIISDFLNTETKNLSVNTKKFYKKILSNFFSFVKKNDKESSLGELDVSLKNVICKENTSDNKYLSEDEINRFLKAIETFEFRGATRVRNKLIFKILLFSDIRISELIKLKIDDLIEREKYYIFSIRKSNKVIKEISIKKDLIRNDLIEWLMIRKCQDNLLFCTIKRKPIDRCYIQKTIKNILLKARIQI